MDAASTLEPLIPDPLPEPVSAAPARATNRTSAAPGAETKAGGTGTPRSTDNEITSAEDALRALAESMADLELTATMPSVDSALQKTAPEKPVTFPGGSKGGSTVSSAPAAAGRAEMSSPEDALLALLDVAPDAALALLDTTPEAAPAHANVKPAGDLSEPAAASLPDMASIPTISEASAVTAATVDKSSDKPAVLATAHAVKHAAARSREAVATVDGSQDKDAAAASATGGLTLVPEAAVPAPAATPSPGPSPARAPVRGPAPAGAGEKSSRAVPRSAASTHSAGATASAVPLASSAAPRTPTKPAPSVNASSMAASPALKPAPAPSGPAGRTAPATSAAAANPPSAPAVPTPPQMDRDFIARNQIVERYLSGKLPIRAATDFERFCRENPELLDELGLPDRVNAGLRLLEASGKPEPWQEAPKKIWEKPHLAIGLGVAVVALIVGVAMLSSFNADKQKQIAALQKQVIEQPLLPATATRTIRLLPSYQSSSHTPAITIGGQPVQLADLKIDMSRSAFKTFRVTIDRIDQGRVGVLHNLMKDSNGHLRIALNSSALGPGNYQLTIEGLNWRGEAEPDAWITIGVQK